MPTLKFLFTLVLNGAGSLAEALDGGQNTVCGLDPADGLGIGVASIDVGGDVCFELADGAVCAVPDLIVGEETEEPLDLKTRINADPPLT